MTTNCKCTQGHWGLHDDGCRDRPSLASGVTEHAQSKYDELEAKVLSTSGDRQKYFENGYTITADNPLWPSHTGTTNNNWTPKVGQVVRSIHSYEGNRLCLFLDNNSSWRHYPYRVAFRSGYETCLSPKELKDASHEWLTKAEIEAFVPLRAKALGIDEGEVQIESFLSGCLGTWEVISQAWDKFTEKGGSYGGLFHGGYRFLEEN